MKVGRPDLRPLEKEKIDQKPLGRPGGLPVKIQTHITDWL